MKLFKIITAAISMLVVISGGLFIYARYVEPTLLNTTNHTVPLSLQSSPLKIVFFSDTHFGRLYSETNIEKIVKEINDAEADIIIFGGDFFDNYYKDSSLLNLDYLKEQLLKLNSNAEKIAIWGNHDYGGGSVRIYEGFMEESGFTVLKNQTHTIKSLNVSIIGLDDLLLGDPNPEAINPSDKTVNIIATHAPDLVDTLNLDGIDLIVSGHSHGGQVNLPIITNRVLPVGAKKYIRGEYEVENAKLIVSKGIGVSNLPYRLFSVPEINVVDIK